MPRKLTKQKRNRSRRNTARRNTARRNTARRNTARRNTARRRLMDGGANEIMYVADTGEIHPDLFNEEVKKKKPLSKKYERERHYPDSPGARRKMIKKASKKRASKNWQKALERVEEQRLREEIEAEEEARTIRGTKAWDNYLRGTHEQPVQKVMQFDAVPQSMKIENRGRMPHYARDHEWIPGRMILPEHRPPPSRSVVKPVAELSMQAISGISDVVQDATSKLIEATKKNTVLLQELYKVMRERGERGEGEGEGGI